MDYPLLTNIVEAARRPLNLKIFATDVHRHSLEVASAGTYEEEALSDVTAPRRERYFVRDDHRYRVAKDLRQLDTQVPLETLRAVVDLALEIGREGREGHPVGTMFVVGDTRKVLNMSKFMNFNPFQIGRAHV